MIAIHRLRGLAAALCCLATVLAAGCTATAPRPTTVPVYSPVVPAPTDGSSPPTTPRPAGADPVIAAAGDIACAPSNSAFNGGAGTQQDCHQGATADLLTGGAGYAAVFALGDLQYDCGDTSAYRRSYLTSWGGFKNVTVPVIGSREYGKACHRDDPSPFFAVFGAAAHPPFAYYSFTLARWHIVVLNSECVYGTGRYQVGGCAAGSPQETWLRADLAAHQGACILAAWNEPRFSSGPSGDAVQTADLWNDLVAAHVSVALAAHTTAYERFAPIGYTPGPGKSRATHAQAVFETPTVDPRGVREFVVGTGGKTHTTFRHAALPSEQLRNGDTYGLLTLRLHARSFDWNFVPEGGYSLTDSGTASCA